MGSTSVANLTAAKTLLLRNPDVGLGAGASCCIAVCTNASMAAQVSASIESLWSSAKQALTPHPVALSAAALSAPGGSLLLLPLLRLLLPLLLAGCATATVLAGCATGPAISG